MFNTITKKTTQPHNNLIIQTKFSIWPVIGCNLFLSNAKSVCKHCQLIVLSASNTKCWYVNRLVTVEDNTPASPRQRWCNQLEYRWLHTNTHVNSYITAFLRSLSYGSVLPEMPRNLTEQIIKLYSASSIFRSLVWSEWLRCSTRASHFLMY